MNLLKVVLSCLVAFVAAVFGLSYLLPTQVQLEQSLLLNATPEQVYTLLNNPMEWERWSPVNKTADPTMIRLFAGPTTGVGARMQWSGDEVGDGQVVLTESIAPGSVTYKEKQAGDETTIEGSFRLAAVEGGTLVFWSQRAQLEKKPIARVKGLWLKYKKYNELKEGLQRLKGSLEEGTPKPSKKRIAAS